MPVLFSESFRKEYYSPLFSMSSCLCLVMLVFVIILPFFAAFATEEFWTKIAMYYEQPRVSFDNQFILYALQGGDVYYYSSVLKLNEYYDNILSVPLVKTESFDDNSDSIVDRFNLKFTFSSTPQSIQNVKLVLFFNYSLQSKAKLSMQTMCMIDLDTPYGASYIYTNGELKLKQKSPISSGTIARALYYTDIFQDNTSPYDFMGIYKVFQSRNLTVSYDYDKVVMPFRSNSETQIELDIIIPSYQPIMYIAPIIYTLKMAWIQYLSIFIPTAIVIYFILYFIYKYQIFETAVINNLPPLIKKVN